MKKDTKFPKEKPAKQKWWNKVKAQQDVSWGWSVWMKVHFVLDYCGFFLIPVCVLITFSCVCMSLHERGPRESGQLLLLGRKWKFTSAGDAAHYHILLAERGRRMNLRTLQVFNCIKDLSCNNDLAEHRWSHFCTVLISILNKQRKSSISKQPS